ncbi:alanyl-tRNA editing protein [Bryobacterales bacterium F-183]|nr:alanyl-tRNA editing protein [Bryobacterales bacterium F-183]
MSVLKLFWEDPYRTELDNVRITNVDGETVTVDRTILYAFSGGQESDAGWLGAHAVTEARKIDGQDIAYMVPGHTFAVGDVTSMRIDWARRYALMRLHFAAELVLELMYRRFAGIEKIGAHIAADKSRIDFVWPESIGPVLPEVAAEVNALVDRDLPVISEFSDPGTQRRYWKIDEFAQVACGGTHVRRTGEVGHVRLKRDNIGKGKQRVNIYLA